MTILLPCKMSLHFPLDRKECVEADAAEDNEAFTLGVPLHCTIDLFPHITLLFISLETRPQSSAHDT
jgi:hypothetical protein